MRHSQPFASFTVSVKKLSPWTAVLQGTSQKYYHIKHIHKGQTVSVTCKNLPGAQWIWKSWEWLHFFDSFVPHEITRIRLVFPFSTPLLSACCSLTLTCSSLVPSFVCKSLHTCNMTVSAWLSKQTCTVQGCPPRHYTCKIKDSECRLESGMASCTRPPCRADSLLRVSLSFPLLWERACFSPDQYCHPGALSVSLLACYCLLSVWKTLNLCLSIFSLSSWIPFLVTYIVFFLIFLHTLFLTYHFHCCCSRSFFYFFHSLPFPVTLSHSS